MPRRYLRVRLGTWNMRHSRRWAVVLDELRGLIGACTVLLTQESRGYAQRMATELPGHGWDVFIAGPGRQSQELVSWDTLVWTNLETGSTLLHRSRLFKSATKYATYVILQHRDTGVLCAFISVHLVSSVERNGRPKLWLPRVLTLWVPSRKVVTQLAADLESRGCVVFGGGDLNVDRNADAHVRHRLFPWRAWWSARGPFTPVWRGRDALPTHGRRCIDYLWSLSSQPVEWVRVRVVKNGSDHNAVLATARVDLQELVARR